jgi:hypothetical protein
VKEDMGEREGAQQSTHGKPLRMFVYELLEGLKDRPGLMLAGLIGTGEPTLVCLRRSVAAHKRSRTSPTVSTCQSGAGCGSGLLAPTLLAPTSNDSPVELPCMQAKGGHASSTSSALGSLGGTQGNTEWAIRDGVPDLDAAWAALKPRLALEVRQAGVRRVRLALEV